MAVELMVFLGEIVRYKKGTVVAASGKELTCIYPSEMRFALRKDLETMIDSGGESITKEEYITLNTAFPFLIVT